MTPNSTAPRFYSHLAASCQFEFLSVSLPKIAEMGTSLCEVIRVFL